jgi:hypothetical protein
MTNKPFTIFDKPMPATQPTMLGYAEISAEELAALKKQIAMGLGHVKPEADVPDELANAVGEFGSATNPVDCASVPACISYLQRLRTTDGSRVKFTRKGCIVDKAVSQYPIDVYLLLGKDGKLLKRIYMSGYQIENSETAPDGFVLMK